MPEVTVLMAVYNGMPYLPEAIESILNQTFGDFEFLIVNDCSTDDTREVVLGYADPRIRLLDNDVNIKQTRSLNRGLGDARAELVARMDDDDISDPIRLEKQYEFMKRNPDVAVVGSSLRFIDADGRPYAELDRSESDVAIRWQQFFFCPIANGAAMFRKSVVWDELGGYDPDIHFSQDWDLWARIPAKYRLANLPEYLLDIRQHPQQETTTSQNAAREEDRKVNRANPRRILALSGGPSAWEGMMDLLLFTEIEQRRAGPAEFLELLEILYTEFCKRYPAAQADPDVLAQLGLEYLIAFNSSGRGHWGTAYKAWRSAWPLVGTKTYLLETLRWFAANVMGARRLKAMFGS